MLAILCSTLLVYVLQTQASEYSSSYYTTYCSGDYSKDISRVFFCQFINSPPKPNVKPVKWNECKPCKELLNRIKWNEHTDKAVDNLLAYTTNHFCDKVKVTTTIECKRKLIVFRPQMKRFLSQIMKDGRFCEALLKCDKKDWISFSSYFMIPGMENTEFYPMQYFEYFFNLENYSKDFYPYMFFNYFYKCQDEGFYPFSDFVMFHDQSGFENEYFFYNYFDSYFTNQTTDRPFFPHSFFEYFFHNQDVEMDSAMYSFFDYFTRYQKYNQHFYPYNFFEYLFSNHTEDHRLNPFYQFYLYYRTPKQNETFCNLCDKTPQSQFQEWRKTIDTKQMSETGYKTMCKDSKNVESCHRMVDQVVSYLTVTLDNALSKEGICHHLFQCPKTVVDEQINEFVFYSTPKQESSGMHCKVCKSISEIFNALIRRQNFDGYIRSEFRKSQCSQIFIRNKEECDKFIKYKLHTYIIETKEVLYKNPLCRPSCRDVDREQVKVQFFDFVNNVGIGNCTVCKAISKMISHLIQSNEFKRIVNYRFEEETCNRLFLNKGLCRVYMAYEYPKIVSNMTKELDNNTLCKQNCRRITEWVTMQMSPRSDKLETNCDLCKEVIEKITKFKPSSNDIDRFLDNVHIMFPETHRSYIQNLIKQYRNELRNYILAGKTKEVICQLVNQCPTNLQFYQVFENYFPFL